MRGRVQKTAQQKRLSGKKASIPVFDRAVELKCPDWMPEEGRTLWNRLHDPLVQAGVLTDPDASVFESLCLSYALMRQAGDALIQEGAVIESKDGPKKNPHHTIYKANADLFRRLAEQFGLSPMSRQRIDVVPPKQGNEWAEGYFA